MRLTGYLPLRQHAFSLAAARGDVKARGDVQARMRCFRKQPTSHTLLAEMVVDRA